MPGISCEVHSFSLSASLILPQTMVHGRQSEAHANKKQLISIIFYLYMVIMVYKTRIFSVHLKLFSSLSLPTLCKHLDILGLGEAQPPELQSVIADETLPGP